MILIYTIAYLWAFFYAYVLVMAAYRAHLAGRLTWPLMVLFSPALIIGYVMDIAAQYTIATVVFRDWPERGEHLVTDRLTRYLTHRSGSRYIKAKWLCEHILDPLDPRGRHC